jgi:tryptophan synthase alpha chain
MFDALGARREGAFGAFVMLGDPDLETSANLLDALIAGGADLIEVGIPFSDPIADGPVIEAAASRALRSGVRPGDCFQLLRDFRARHANVPVGLLTYANLVVAGGREAFYARAAAAGVDSVLVADVPALEAEPFVSAALAAGVDPVLIAATNTPPTTLERLARLGHGYTYCVARAGVTGVRAELDLDHGRLFASLRDFNAPPPILGFGIATPDHVRSALGAGAAGVISGSAIVSLIAAAREGAVTSVRGFVARMKAATLPGRSARSPGEQDDVRR